MTTRTRLKYPADVVGQMHLFTGRPISRNHLRRRRGPRKKKQDPADFGEPATPAGPPARHTEDRK